MSTRRLAAIMFTDIVGYTAMMQESESHAVAVRSRHREVFERLHEQYQGTILQYYGDGTLSIFDSAVAATKCAIEMQLAFQEEPAVPLRIGIHTGDIIYSEEEAIGDGVNVAARVESVATAGSVMVSKRVADYLQNQSEIPLLSMGHFSFKNVKEELEVFAVDREGLDLPNPKKISGKFSKHRAPNEKQGLAKIPIWARYIGGFVLFLILAPIIYFPLYRTFSSTAANQEDPISQNLADISVEDQKRFYVSSFEHTGTDSTADWLAFGLPYALEMEWDQDPHILNMYNEGIKVEPIKSDLELADRLGGNYLLRGKYQKKEAQYELEVVLYEVPSGQVFQTMNFVGEELFSLLDTVSLATKNALGLSEDELSGVRDLPVRQILTNSLPAYQRFCEAYLRYANGDYSKMGVYEREAVGMDSSFAWAAFKVANTAYQSFQNDELAQQFIKIAMEHRKRLPDIFEAKVRQLNFRIADEPEKALELSKLLVELNPVNFSYRSVLLNDYMSQDMYEEALAQVSAIHQLTGDPCADFFAEAAILLRLGRIKEGIERGLRCQEAESDNARVIQSLGELYLADGDYEQATQAFQRADLLESNFLDWDKFSAHLRYMQDSVPQDLTTLFPRIIGRYYRSGSTVPYFDVSTIGSLLFITGERQLKYYSYYPSAKNRFISMIGSEATFTMDKAGDPVSIFIKSGSNNENTLKYIPPQLEEARLQTINDNRAAVKKALAAVPETQQSGWMYESLVAIQAFREAATTTFNTDGISGEYMDEEGFGIRISLSDEGEIEVGLTRNPNIGNFRFLAIGEAEAVSLELVEHNIRFIRENGIVSKLEIHYVDKEPLILNHTSD